MSCTVQSYQIKHTLKYNISYVVQVHFYKTKKVINVKFKEHAIHS